jgi:RNA polymerase sigma-70 factor (ECF subfamily)
MSQSPPEALRIFALHGRQPSGKLRLEEIRRVVEECYSARRATIYRYVVSLTRNPAEVEDLTQEVFLRLYDGLADGSLEEIHFQWLLTVARNMVVDLARKRRSETAVTDAVDRALREACVDPRESIEECLVVEARSEEWTRALGTLTGIQKSCLEFRADGITFREISELLNVPISTAVDQTNRAIEKLRRRVRK